MTIIDQISNQASWLVEGISLTSIGTFAGRVVTLLQHPFVILVALTAILAVGALCLLVQHLQKTENLQLVNPNEGFICHMEYQDDLEAIKLPLMPKANYYLSFYSETQARYVQPVNGPDQDPELPNIYLIMVKNTDCVDKCFENRSTNEEIAFCTYLKLNEKQEIDLERAEYKSAFKSLILAYNFRKKWQAFYNRLSKLFE